MWGPDRYHRLPRNPRFMLHGRLTQKTVYALIEELHRREQQYGKDLDKGRPRRR